MISSILNQQLQKYRSQVDEIVKDLHELTIQIQHAELAQTVSELRNRINEPFMFVIVGEVKAGKSSFINALLDTGREITKVAPQPMTDTIQQLVYGEEEEITVLNPFLKRMALPVDILKEIAIVDTPGTNTIIEKHQEITERFIPASDLIVFVFEAKNPYRQSAWDFFEYIHGDWRKKIIFVLQQKDLMSPEDLAVNEKGVVEHAQKKGIAQPQVFCVSAKQEQEGNKSDSGFGPMRQYIRDNITGGKAPVLKLRNNLDLSKNICDRIAQGLEIRQKQWDADTAFRADIRDTLEKQAQQSGRQVGILVENLLAGYDRITRQKGDQLKEGLSVFTLIRRTFAGIFSKQASAKEWLEQLANDLGTDLELELQRKLQEGVVDLAESIQQMAKMIDLKIQHSQTILKDNHAIFSAIAERRSNVLRELQDAFERFMNRSENFTARELFPDNQPLSPNLLAGSGLAVIGTILAIVAQGAVFDVTGGVLASIGFLFAGISTSIKRRKVLQGFAQEIDKGRKRMENEVTEKLDAYVEQLKQKIDANFHDFDAMLETEKEQIAKISASQRQVARRIEGLDGELPKV
ncbi:MAG: dynamin family protein [Lewinellaceae bacterium]|nr:dynamin family protein [Lewinellaceae bacterium]